MVQDFTPFRSKAGQHPRAKGPDILLLAVSERPARACIHAAMGPPEPGARPSPRARPPQGRARKGGAPALGAAGRAGGPGLSGWAGRRAFFPQRAGGAGRGAGRGAGPGGARGRSSSCGGGLVRPVLPLPGCSVHGPSAAERTRTGTCTGSDAAPGAPLAGGGCATMADKEAGSGDPGVPGERAARVLGCQQGGPGEGGKLSATPLAPSPGRRESRRPDTPRPPSLLGSGAAPRQGRESGGGGG